MVFIFLEFIYLYAMFIKTFGVNGIHSKILILGHSDSCIHMLTDRFKYAHINIFYKVLIPKNYTCIYMKHQYTYIYIFKLLESQVIGVIKGELEESFHGENMLPASTSYLSSTSSKERQHIPISKTFNFNL